jgi:hypothetical protein
MKFTTHLGLHSQTNRLVEDTTYGERLPAVDGVLTLYDTLFQGIWAGTLAESASLNYNSPPEGRRF